MRERLVEGDTVAQLALGTRHQLAECWRVLLLDHPEACLLRDVVRERDLRRSGGVEDERGLAPLEPPRGVAVHRPVAGLDRAPLLLRAAAEGVSVRDARAQCD